MKFKASAEKTSRTKGYRLASILYDPLLEKSMESTRELILKISGIQDGDKVLDVCCGTGGQAQQYARTGAQVFGIDLSEYMIKKAKKKETQNLKFALGDGTETPYDDSFFDMASSCFSLHEVIETVAEGFLHEMRRVTKRGGALVFADFSEMTEVSRENKHQKKVLNTIERWLGGGEHYRNYLSWIKKGGLAGFLSRNELATEKAEALSGGNILIARTKNMK